MIDTLQKNISRNGPLNRRSLHFAPPNFLVETRGFDDLHAALFKESRTRGRR
jgi:hypothetical protein